jgi:hypothetical protein
MKCLSWRRTSAASPGFRGSTFIAASGSDAAIVETLIFSSHLLLLVEPGAHSRPFEIDPVVDPPSFRKTKALIVTPPPQGDGANAKALAQPRCDKELRLEE